MASIDKIYGTRDNFYELREFIVKNNSSYLGFMYPEDGISREEENNIIAMFPEYIDMWLLENCKIDWVIDRIKYQYDIEQ